MRLLRPTSLAWSFVLAGCAGASPPPRAPPPQKCAAAPADVASKPPPVAPPAQAPRVKTPEEALARLFTAAKADAVWFAPSFVEKIPASKIDAIVAETKKEAGAFTKVERAGDQLFAVMEKGRIPIKLSLDGEGHIKGLWLSPTEPTVAPPREEVLAGLRALPGRVSVLVLTDGKELLAHEADAPMAVGSTFKLAILDALRERIDAKKARWTDIVRLEPRNKSLPSGKLQTWPDRAPLTLHTVAGLMISESDNTATDVLLDYVGREAVERLAPGNAPFMSTRDAFVLKEKSSLQLLERWRAADSAARRKMLPDLASTKLGERDQADAPTVDVEWMFSARRLCDLLSRTKDLDVTRINPGIASAKDWDLAAYKGGSEPGVLNFTSWVEKAGKKHCVVTTWNDPAKEVDGAKLYTLHGALLRGLRDAR